MCLRISMISPDQISEALIFVNQLRLSNKNDVYQQQVERLIDLLFNVSQTLAVYGSLKPGKENHHLISDLKGEWHKGYINGIFYDQGWGAGLGYPAVRWNPSAEEIPVHVLISGHLPHSWDWLDDFEGEDYCRILVPVYQGKKVRWVANIYESAIK